MVMEDRPGLETASVWRHLRQPTQAVFLDLDGTLLDDGLDQEVIVRTCKEIEAVQPGLDHAQLAEANDRARESYWPQVAHDFMTGAIDGASVGLETWRRTLQACGCGDESVAQYAAQAHSRLAREAYRLFDDVLEFITVAREAHVPLALITNGASDTQRDKVRALNIESWFDCIVISGEAGVAKPAPAVFELALDKLGVEKEAVCHVGDSLASDVAGANAAGITSVWLNRNGAIRAENDPKPDLEIRSLSELLTLQSK